MIYRPATVTLMPMGGGSGAANMPSAIPKLQRAGGAELCQIIILYVYINVFSRWICFEYFASLSAIMTYKTANILFTAILVFGTSRKCLF